MHLVGFHCTCVSRCTVLRMSNTDGIQGFVNTVVIFRLSYIAVHWPTSWTPLIISRLTLLHSFIFYHHSWLWIIFIITTRAHRIIFIIITVTFTRNVSKLRYLWATISCCTNINLLSSLLSFIPCDRNVSTVWSFVQIVSLVKTLNIYWSLNKDRPTWCHLLYYFII